MSYMYGGSILTIDLSEEKITKEPTSSYSRDFLGGRGINIKLLYDMVPPGLDPLAPDSPLIFGAGPLVGSPIPASRTEITAKSPETGFLGSSNIGGFWGPELKFAGYDHVVITGKAEKPVYIWIENERVEIKDASMIWGKDTYETQDILRNELDPETEIVCIGQAGENLVRFAAIQHRLGHSASRTGMGTVMGSKNLKAIAVHGTKEVSLADPDKYLSVCEEVNAVLQKADDYQEIHQHGWVRDMDQGRFRLEDPDWIPNKAGDILKKYTPKRAGCRGCACQCFDLYPPEVFGGGMIHCTMYAMPFPVRMVDLDIMLEYGFLCQRYGIDAVSTINIIAWLMWSYDKGLITAKDTDGIPMEWGKREAIIGILKKIVSRDGIGNVLADGMVPAVKSLGRGTEEYAWHVRGLPLYSTYTPNRTIPLKGVSLGNVLGRGDNIRNLVYYEYAQVYEKIEWRYGDDKKNAAKKTEVVRNRLKEIAGTDKAPTYEDYDGKPEIVAYLEDGTTIVDMLGFCKMQSGVFTSTVPVLEDHQATLLSVGTGIDYSDEMLFNFARKVKNLERAYDVREGLTRDLDSLPKNMMDKPLKRGKFKGSVLETNKFEQMKSKYYALRGWDVATGIPTHEVLEKTGLGDIAKDLEKNGKLPGQPLKRQNKKEKNVDFGTVNK